MRSDTRIVRCTKCGCEYRVGAGTRIACPACRNDSWVLAEIRAAAA